jgi:membrane protein DedA with SNARE-associated domain
MFEELTVVVQSLVLSFGPIGIFLGMILESSVVPIPSEAVLVAVGSIGFNPLEVAIYGGIGSTIGAMIGYYIGRYGGRPFFERCGKYFFVTPDKLKVFDAWFKRWGAYAVLFGRLIPVIPHKIFSIGAGLARMNTKHFFIFTLIGSIPRAFLLAYFGSLVAGNTALMIVVMAIFFAIPVIMSKIRR